MRWIILILCILITKPIQASKTPSTIGKDIVVNSGICSMILINSSGANFNMKCNPDQKKEFPEDSIFQVILGYSQAVPAIAGVINWRFVDLANSDIKIKVDGKQVVNEDLTKPFDDAVLRLKSGVHTLQIETNLSYFAYNGQQADPASARCQAVLNVQAPGKIYPQFILNQSQDGSLYPIKCGFNIL